MCNKEKKHACSVRVLSIQVHPMDEVSTGYGFVDTINTPYVYYYGPFNHVIENNLKDLSPSKTSFSFGELHLF